MTDEGKRLSYIDLFKAFGILFMIMGHIDFGNRFDLYIHAFHMPMFFFISGYLFTQRDFKSFIERKFKSLIIPYLSFGLFNCVMCFFLIENFRVGRYFERLFFFNNKGIDIAGALWFLTCLFFVNLLFWLFHRYFRKFVFAILILLICEYYFRICLPFSIDSAIYMLPVFYSGYVFKLYEFKADNRQNFVLLVVLFLLSYVLIFKNGYVNVRSNIYSNIFLFYLNVLLASLFYYYLSKFLSEFKFSQICNYVGKNSLIYLALNQLFIIFASRLFAGGGGQSSYCACVSSIYHQS